MNNIKERIKDNIIFWIVPLIVVLFWSFVFIAIFTPHRINAKIRCIDGDTFSIGKEYYRLAHIDTPEKEQPGYKAASVFTCNWLNNNKFDLIRQGNDKYSRTLVIVKSKTETLNTRLISECLAEPFYTNTVNEIIYLYKSKCK